MITASVMKELNGKIRARETRILGHFTHPGVKRGLGTKWVRMVLFKLQIKNCFCLSQPVLLQIFTYNIFNKLFFCKNKLHLKAVACRNSVKKVLLKFLQNNMKTPVPKSLILIKCQTFTLQFFNFIKIQRYNCFPVNFAKV